MKNRVTSKVIRTESEKIGQYEDRTYFTYICEDAAKAEEVTGGYASVILEADGTPVFKVDYKIPVS